MLNRIIFGLAVAAASFFALAYPPQGTPAWCHAEFSRSVSACTRTTNPVIIDGVRYDRYNTRAECEAAYKPDLEACLATGGMPGAGL
ncbi:hypothetical protein [Ferrimonas aestuarii]|uniref:YARHG domain-containing protein n=1 Tax=Ferrimonas aestuarii TaxID=2569539 RepID=A0A4U1BN87_9GAMM|nr:hypothetical protein [Ferrimonas aestuarii]TKB53329.1 hypothetical protein FCL42_14775 [Ferrimonas aestuarii]